MSFPALRAVVSVSGIRGIVGETFAPDQALGLAAAFAATVAQGGRVVLGRDSRPTGELFAQAVAAGLRGAGCDVIDLGIVPTPTVPVMIGELSAAGGIQVSASHNNVEWNALKFFSGTCRNIDQTQLDRLLAAYAKPPTWSRWAGVGGWRLHDGALDVHLARVLRNVDVERIRARRFTVLIDSVNGAGSVIAPRLLARLGCRVVPVWTRPDQPFPRDPEPTAANLATTCALVAAAGADLGFVQDPDADRLAIIDARGRYIGEEYTLVLCALARIGAAIAAGSSPRQVVACTNLSTSRMLDDVASRFGTRVERSRVGEAHVVDAMERHGAVIGGEGNGGVIDPRVVIGRDSQAGMALVLDLLAREGAALHEVVAGIPAYAMHKEKIALDRDAVAAALPRVQAHALARGATVDTRDGLKLAWPDRWVHLRASGTEPVSRIIAEAPTAAEASALAIAVRQAAGAALAGH